MWVFVEFDIWTHLGICLYRFSALNFSICVMNWWKILDFQVYGLRNKARTFIGKKDNISWKRERKTSLTIAKRTRRFAKLPLDRPKFTTHWVWNGKNLGGLYSLSAKDDHVAKSVDWDRGVNSNWRAKRLKDASRKWLATLI